MWSNTIILLHIARFPFQTPVRRSWKKWRRTFSPYVKCASPRPHFLSLTYLPVAIYVFYAQSSLIWHFSALKPNSELIPIREHSFQVNIQAALPDVQLTKSFTVQYFCPVLPLADHYYTQGFWQVSGNWFR